MSGQDAPAGVVRSPNLYHVSGATQRCQLGTQMTRVGALGRHCEYNEIPDTNVRRNFIVDDREKTVPVVGSHHIVGMCVAICVLQEQATDLSNLYMNSVLEDKSHRCGPACNAVADIMRST